MPVPASVALHRYRSLDRADPGAGLRGFDGYVAVADAAAASTKPIAVVSTDPSGRFRFDLPSLGMYEIHASGEGGARTCVTFTAGVTGVHKEFRLDLPAEPVSLPGRVTHADGRPFQGVVELGPTGGKSHWWLSEGVYAEPCDARGAFRFGGLAPGRYQLWATKAGQFRYPWGVVHLPYDADIEVRLPDGQARVHGRVIDDDTGYPIPHARVVVTNAQRRRPLHVGHEMVHVITADADGMFSSWLTSFWCLPVATAPGYGLGEGIGLAGQGVIVVRVPRPTTLEGRVVRRSDGSPVAGVPVSATMDSELLRRSLLLPATATSDANGRFKIEHAGRYVRDVVAFGNGWHSGGLTRVRWAGENDRGDSYGDDLLVEVVPTSRVQGVLLNHAGDPVAGASVYLHNPYTDFDLGWPLTPWQVGSVATDDQGRFSLETVDGAERTLWITAPGIPSFKAALGRQEHQIHGPMELRAPVSGWIRVAAKPLLSDASVFANYENDWAPDLPSARTDASGQALLGPLRKEDVTVRVRARGHGWVVGEAQAPASSVGEDPGASPAIPVTMPSVRSFSGRVVGPLGAPISRALLIIRTPGWTGGFYAEARIEADGAFTVHDAPSVPLEAEATLWWRGQQLRGTTTVVGEAGATVVTLSAEEPLASHALTLRVRDAAGAPVRRATATYHRKRGEYPAQFRTTVIDGTAVVHHPPDSGGGWVEITNLPTADLGVAVEGPIGETPGEMEIRVLPGRTLRGRFIAKDGESVSGVTVRARSARLVQEGLHATRFEVARSDADGRFVLRGLPKGDIELEFACPGGFIEPDPLTVAADELDLEIALDRAIVARLRVLDDEGRPACGLKVTADALGVPKVTDEHGDLRWRRGWVDLAITDARGVAVLERLAPDLDFKLSIEPWRHGVWSRGVHERTLDAWKPKSEVVRVERKVSTSGRVQGPGGETLPVAWLAHPPQDGSDRPGRIEVDEQGAFSIGWLRRGQPLDLYLVLRNSPEESLGAPTIGSPPTWTIKGGTQGAALSLPEVPLELSAKIDGWRPRGGGSLSAWLRPDPMTDRFRGTLESVEDDGSVAFRNLPKGASFDLWIHDQPNGTYVLRRGLTPRTEPWIVTPKAGGSISGRILWPEGHVAGKVRIQAWSDELSVGVWLGDHAGEAFRLRGLPNTTWRVTVTAGDGADSAKGEATAKTDGPPISIEVK